MLKKSSSLRRAPLVSLNRPEAELPFLGLPALVVLGGEGD